MHIVDPVRVALPDVSLSVHQQGEGFPVVLCHGFPELACSWRHQITALAEAGYRVIAPDMRGYGASDCPAGVEAYGMKQLAGDMVALLDALDLEKAVFAGHDWGGFVAWAMPVLHPERTAGVIGVNTPYMPFPSTAFLQATFQNPEDMYILWFQEPGTAEAFMDQHTALIFDKLMRDSERKSDHTPADISAGGQFNPFLNIVELPEMGAPLLSTAELAYYTAAFQRSGFASAINWYRNIDANCANYPTLGFAPLELPCLMVTAERDRALPPVMAQSMPERVSDLEMHMIKGCGHWTQQEKPEELNRLMLDFLQRCFPS
ncbi:MAG: alpha/beta hydrolase [Polyangiaceae bacterium]|nr:alpha/beta hydrolase [Polyangiaceae bacterium]